MKKNTACNCQNNINAAKHKLVFVKDNEAQKIRFKKFGRFLPTINNPVNSISIFFL